MKNLKYLILLFTVFLTVSCGDDDPKVPAMEWKTTAKVVDGEITVSPSGETYSMECTNYPGFWIESLQEGSSAVALTDKNHAKGQWINAGVANGQATVIVSPNNSGSKRSGVITFTMGDTSTSFRLTQEPLSTTDKPSGPIDTID